MDPYRVVAEPVANPPGSDYKYRYIISNVWKDGHNPGAGVKFTSWVIVAPTDPAEAPVKVTVWIPNQFDTVTLGWDDRHARAVQDFGRVHVESNSPHLDVMWERTAGKA